MRILILCPYSKEQEIFNIIKPLSNIKKQKILNNDIFAKLNKSLHKEKSFIFSKIATGMMLKSEDKGTINDISGDNLTFIGMINNKVEFDRILCYMPDVVQAQELLLETRFKYFENFVTTDKAQFNTDSMNALFKEYDRLLNGIAQ